MNLLDLAIIIVFVLFILSGIHRGFWSSVLSIFSSIVSWIFGMLFMFPIASLVKGSSSIFGMLLYYTEGSEFVPDVELIKVNVETLSPERITEIVNKSALPYPFGKEIIENVNSLAFKEQGITQLGDYYNQTIVCVVVNIIAFLIIFFALRVLFAFIIDGADYAVRFPNLVKLNTPICAGIGFLNGVLTLFAIFMLVPLVLIAMDFDFIHALLDESFFAPFFYHKSLLLAMMPGV